MAKLFNLTASNMNRPKAIIEGNNELEQYEMYSEEPLCDHDGDGARQHIATIYDHEEAREILRLWNSLENAESIHPDTKP